MNPRRLPLSAAQFTAARLLHPGEAAAKLHPTRTMAPTPTEREADNETWEAFLAARFDLFMQSTEGNHNMTVEWHIAAVLAATRSQ